MTDSGKTGGRKRKTTRKRIILIALAFVLIGAGTYTLARYVLQDRVTDLAEAAGFRFSSDWLKEGGASYDFYDWQNNGFDIKLYNHENGVTTKVDIGYSVEITGNATCSPASGTIELSETADTLSIMPSAGAAVGNKITVAVTTTPYNKPLSATFTLKDPGNSSHYTFTDDGYYCTLTIKTGSAQTSPITINYGNNFAPDNLNDLMRGWTGPGRSGSLTVQPNSAYTLIFFEDVLDAYDSQSVTIANNIITLP